MKKTSLSFITLGFCGLLLGLPHLFFQFQPTKPTHVAGQYTYGDSSKLFVWQPEAKVPLSQFLNESSGLLPDKNGREDLNLKKETSGARGARHYRYEQTFMGIPVLGAGLVIHVRDNLVESANGFLLRGLNLSAVPVLREEDALQIALFSFPAVKYAWQEPAFEQMLQAQLGDARATFYPKGNLVILSENRSMNPADYRLAYAFDLLALQPESRQVVYVDAQTGEILSARQRQFQCTEIGTGVSQFGPPIVEIITNSCLLPGQYCLRDSTRGDGVFTKDGLGTPNSVVEVCDDNNFFNELADRAGVDAHWAMEQFYDFLLQNFAWDSYDGEGAKMETWVNFQSNNWASWNGIVVKIAPANGTHHPAASLEAIGHEFTHGLVTNTSNLIYIGESGAIHEGICDVMGICAEFEKDPNGANWKLGDGIPTNGSFIRSLDNPNEKGHPDTYLGDYWVPVEGCLPSPINDCGIHKNSLVFSHWFYRLAEGGTGTNDVGTYYSLAGIGREKAMELVFELATNWLTPTSGFAEARAFSIAAATSIGFSTDEIEQVAEAWCAVGVGDCTITSNQSVIVLDAPNGGQSLQGGQAFQILWNSQFVPGKVTIQLSLNGGGFWQTLVSDTDNDGVYEWTVPPVNSDFCLIRVVASETNPPASAVSAGMFSIGSCTELSYFKVSDLNPCPGETITVNNFSSPLAKSFVWALDGSIISTEAGSLQLEIDAPGAHQLELVGIDSLCSDTFRQTITVAANPDAAFSAATDNGQIMALALHPASTYLWTLNNILQGQANSLSMPMPSGEYELCLTISTDCGSDTHCETMVVTEEPPACGNATGEQWETFVNNPTVNDMVEEGNFVWQATNVGISRIDKITHQVTFWFRSNSDLPDHNVTCIDVDNQGVAWAGTAKGLVKIENGELHVSSPPGGGDLLSVSIARLRAGNDGSLWIIFSNAGIGRYHNGTLTAFQDLGVPLTLGYNSMSVFNGGVYVGTSQGAFKLEDSGQFSHWTTADGLVSNYVYDVIEDAVGRVWAAYGSNNGGGVSIRKPDGTWVTFTNPAYPQLPSNYVYELFPGNNGTVWIGSSANQGIVNFDGDSTWVEIDVPTVGNVNPDSYINSSDEILIANDGYFWIGKNGTGLFSSDQLTTQKIDVRNTPMQNFSGSDIAFDASGNLWAGQSGKFVKWNNAAWTEYVNPIYPYSIIKYLATGGDFVYGITSDDLYKYRTTDNVWFQVPLNGYPINDTEAEARGSEYWVCLNNIGLAKVEGTTVTVFDEDQGLPKKHVRDFELLPDGQAWLVTGDDTLTLFNGVDASTHFLVGSNIQNNTSYALVELTVDPDGNVWLIAGLGYYSYLLKFDMSTGAWSNEKSFYNLSIRDMAFDPAGKLWMPTIHQGIMSYEPGASPGTGQLSYFKEEDTPILDNLTYDLGIHPFTGCIWTATLSGVSVLCQNSFLSADFQITSSDCAGQAQSFISTSPGASQYEWKVNGQAYGFSPGFEHEFQPGKHLVTLTVSNGSGCSATHSEFVTVHPQADLSNWAGDVLVCDGAPFVEAGIGGMASYQWKLGNDDLGSGDSFYPTTSGEYTLTVADYCGQSATVNFEVLIDNACVWPGDFYPDGIVNHYDLVAFALGFGETGPSRVNPTSFWDGQPAFDFGNLIPYFANLNQSNDIKTLDANGDGVVDLLDVRVHEANYGLTHGFTSPSSPPPGPLELVADIVLIPDPNDTTRYIMKLTIRPKYGEFIALDGVYGLAFTLEYTLPDGVTLENLPEIDYSTSELGSPGTGLLTLSKHHPTLPRIEAAVARLNKQNQSNVSSFGTVDYQLLIEDNLMTGDTLYFSFTINKVLMVSSEGNLLPVGDQLQGFNLVGEGQGTTETKPEPQSLSWLQVYPNPGNGHYLLKFDSPVHEEGLFEIFDVNGNSVWSQESSGQPAQTTADLSELPTGAYILTFRSGTQFHSCKLVNN